jgi:glutaredoxin
MPRRNSHLANVVAENNTHYNEKDIQRRGKSRKYLGDELRNLGNGGSSVPQIVDDRHNITVVGTSVTALADFTYFRLKICRGQPRDLDQGPTTTYTHASRFFVTISKHRIRSYEGRQIRPESSRTEHKPSARYMFRVFRLAAWAPLPCIVSPCKPALRQECP